MAAKSDDYIIRLRANNEDLKKKLVQSRGALKRHKSFVSKISGQTSTLMAGMFGGAVLAAGITSAARNLAGFEFQMDKVAAISGATAEEVKTLTENAKDLGARSQFTATQIGNLQEELARLGFSTDKIVNITDSARKLAQVADTELGPAAKVVGQQLNAFGLAATEADRVANLMAESFSKSSLDLEQFAIGMSFAASSGKAAGFSIEEVTAMLGKLTDSGIQGSKAGTALRDMFSDLSISGMTLDEALLQINDSTNKNKTAFELFGKTSQNAAIILAEQREETLKLTAALSDQNRELNDMVAIMEDNLLTDYKLLGSAIDGTVQKGSFFTPMLRGMTQGLTHFINAMSAPAGQGVWYTSAEEGLKKVEAETEALNRAQTTASEIVRVHTFAVENNIKSMADLMGMNGRVTRIIDPLANKFDVLRGVMKLLTAEQEKLTASQKKYNDEVNALAAKKSTGTADVSSIKSGGINAPEMTMSIPKFPKEGANAVLEELDAFHKAQNKKMLEQSAVFKAIAEGSIEQAIGAFAEGLADGGLKAAFAGLFDVIGSGLKTLGSALIAYGVSMKAFKEAFKGNPALAIGAGIAAIAAGSMVQNAAQSLSGAGGGGGGGGGSAGNMQRQSNININVQGDSMIRGSDIYTSYNIQQKQSGRRNGG